MDLYGFKDFWCFTWFRMFFRSCSNVFFVGAIFPEGYLFRSRRCGPISLGTEARPWRSSHLPWWSEAENHHRDCGRTGSWRGHESTAWHECADTFLQDQVQCKLRNYLGLCWKVFTVWIVSKCTQYKVCILYTDDIIRLLLDDCKAVHNYVP